MLEQEQPNEREGRTVIADYLARGMASEATQALRSHEKMTAMQLENIKTQQDDIKKLIEDTNNKIDDGFKSYDNKFWTLAISIIGLLGSGILALLWKILFPH